jgi:prolipoprotein diacylglyceryltransferase
MCGFLLPTAMKFLRDLKASRYYTFLYLSLWKIACLFLTMLVVTYIQYDSSDPVGNLFDLFTASFSQRNITVNEVRTVFTDIRKKNSLFEGPAVTGRKI